MALAGGSVASGQQGRAEVEPLYAARASRTMGKSWGPPGFKYQIAHRGERGVASSVSCTSRALLGLESRPIGLDLALCRVANAWNLCGLP